MEDVSIYTLVSISMEESHGAILGSGRGNKCIFSNTVIHPPVLVKALHAKSVTLPLLQIAANIMTTFKSPK